MEGDTDILIVNNITYHLSQLSAEERLRVKHLKQHEIHKGHEKMHLEIFLIALGCVFVCQTLLVIWNKRHFKSYQITTLFFMWLVPFLYSVAARFPRFIVIWFLYSLVTGTMLYIASKKRIGINTPRRVYRWFLSMHNASYAFGVGGYVLLLLTLFNFNLLFLLPTELAMNVALLSLFYGLYFGVISRDFAEVCTDKMAAQIGYSVPDGMPLRRLDPTVCSICTLPLDSTGLEKTYKLNCSHVFHDFCIRGWCIVGKKDTCPYCKEKVNLKRTFSNPWDKPHILYGNLLDWIRYLVAWQPVILVIIKLLTSGLGLD